MWKIMSKILIAGQEFEVIDSIPIIQTEDMSKTPELGVKLSVSEFAHAMECCTAALEYRTPYVRDDGYAKYKIYWSQDGGAICQKAFWVDLDREIEYYRIKSMCIHNYKLIYEAHQYWKYKCELCGYVYHLDTSG